MEQNETPIIPPTESAPAPSTLDFLPSLARISEVVGMPLRFEAEHLDQNESKVCTIKAFMGEGKDHFLIGVSKGTDDFKKDEENAGADLVKKLISKMVLDVPQGAVGFVVTTPTGPMLKYNEKNVAVIVHNQSKHSSTFTVVQQ